MQPASQKPAVGMALRVAPADPTRASVEGTVKIVTMENKVTGYIVTKIKASHSIKSAYSTSLYHYSVWPLLKPSAIEKATVAGVSGCK